MRVADGNALQDEPRRPHGWQRTKCRNEDAPKRKPPDGLMHHQRAEDLQFGQQKQPPQSGEGCFQGRHVTGSP